MINVTPFNDPLRCLSDREQQIVKLLGDGKSLTEISALLPLGLDLRRRYK
jgi:DNA-binding NarL/FixJ family response regulator